MVIERGGIRYAQGRMNEYKDKALNILEGAPDGEAKTALKNLVLYTIERTK